MFNKLGYGKGCTILACLAIILGCPAYVHLISSSILNSFYIHILNFYFFCFYSFIKIIAPSCYGSMVAGYAWVVNTPINQYNIRLWTTTRLRSPSKRVRIRAKRTNILIKRPREGSENVFMPIHWQKWNQWFHWHFGVCLGFVLRDLYRPHTRPFLIVGW